MAGLGFELVEIERLIKLVESRELARLEIEEGGRRIRITGLRRPVAVARQAGSGKAEESASTARPDDEQVVESPMVGVFYRGPSPDLPPFLNVGDHVETGQTIGIIEAMKVFSELPSPLTGTVTDIPAGNGALVRQGEPLMYIRVES